MHACLLQANIVFQLNNQVAKSRTTVWEAVYYIWFENIEKCIGKRGDIALCFNELRGVFKSNDTPTTRTFQLRYPFRVNHATALRAVLKPELSMSSRHKQHKHRRYTPRLGTTFFYRRLQSFQSMFESISIDYKTLEHWSYIILYLKILICCLFLWHPRVALKSPLIWYYGLF